MLASRSPVTLSAARPDLFRDTLQRWTTAAGGVPPTVCDYAFCVDGSLAWRIVAGPAQGQAGRSRTFHAQPVGPGLHLLTFAARPGTRITAVLDFRRNTVTGYDGPVDDSHPFAGTFEAL